MTSFAGLQVHICLISNLEVPTQAQRYNDQRPATISSSSYSWIAFDPSCCRHRLQLLSWFLPVSFVAFPPVFLYVLHVLVASLAFPVFVSASPVSLPPCRHSCLSLHCLFSRDQQTSLALDQCCTRSQVPCPCMHGLHLSERRRRFPLLLFPPLLSPSSVSATDTFRHDPPESTVQQRCYPSDCRQLARNSWHLRTSKSRTPWTFPSPHLAPNEYLPPRHIG
mmetsp:Transcript_27400/g.40172  ORF Transcript_27400/g.40172 Transcript_27400/m.40172 type:complete len:222 (+) Transcript_27400:278-943(+)